MRIILLLTVLLFQPEFSRGQTPDEIIEQIWQRMGGREAFSDARFLEFTFQVNRGDSALVSRNHLWDRISGDYVLSMERDGSHYRIYFNVQTQIGNVFESEKRLSGPEEKKWLEKAYSYFINDTYWLLVPAKLNDPGVSVSLDQVKKEPGVSVLHLSFDQVGLTPGDQYWLYISDNGDIVRWSYILENGSNRTYIWSAPVDCGAGLRFSLSKTRSDGQYTILFPHVRFYQEMPQDRFLPVPK